MSKTMILPLLAVVILGLSPWSAGGQKPHHPGLDPAAIRWTGGFRIVRVNPPSSPTSRLATSTHSAATAVWPHARVPFDGFSPLVAITTTNYKATGSDNWAHLLSGSLQGTALNPPLTTHYAIGIFDSGSVVDLIGYCDSQMLGMTGSVLSGNTITLVGVSGNVEAPISYPVGIFAAGLSAIGPTGELNTGQLVGHGNVAAVVGPAEDCQTGYALPSLVGNIFAGFFTTVIRVDQPQRVMVGGSPVVSPEVQIRPLGSAPGISYAHSIRMNVSGMSLVTTASYYPDILNPMNPNRPWIPTLLSGGNGTLPLGGGFFAQMSVLMGPPGPTNPLQTMRVLVDTGAQACVITPGMAANLSLPVQPHFTVDVQGVGGILRDVPGYYIDYLKINALGGALEFSRVPMVMLDVSSPDGQTIDGIMGMNLFWNRNVIFDPRLQSDGALRVSAPVLAPADLDRDTDVDGADLALFAACVSGPAIPQTHPACLLQDLDSDGDVDQADFGLFQRCFSGSDQPALPDCAR